LRKKPSAFMRAAVWFSGDLHLWLEIQKGWRFWKC